VITGQATQLDASGSTDPDGTVERYQWDLDGNGSYETDTGGSPTTSRFYDAPGNVSVGLMVTDDDGKTAEAHRTITVNKAPPFADGPTVPPPSGDPLPGTTPGGTPPGQLPNADPPPKPSAKAPRGGFRIVSFQLRDVLARGLAIRFSTSEAATARFQITLSASDARRLGLGHTTMRIGKVTKLAGAGRASLRIRLTKTARTHLAAHRLSKPLRLGLTMTLIGEGGASRSYSSHVSLSR
jgi:YD repeat-containing protein